MHILSRVVKRYSELLAISVTNYKDYLSLRRELIIAIIGITVSAALAITISTLLRAAPHSTEISIMSATTGSILSLSKILARISRSLERIKGLDEELPYLVFMASAVAKTGLELIEAMHFISASETHVFKYFKSLSRRIANASKYAGIDGALDKLAGIPRSVRKVLITYLSSISLGTGVETLNTMGLEMIREASRQASRSIDLSAQAGLAIIMVLTTIPVLTLGISSILGEHVALSTGTLISVGMPVIILLLPQAPLPLRLTANKDRDLYLFLLSMLSIGLIASTYVLIYLLALSFIKASVLKILLVILSILMISAGSLWLVVFTNYLANMGKTRDILISANSYAKTYRTLEGFDIKRKARKIGPYAPWILHYVMLSIDFLKEKGDIEPIVLTRFSEEVTDIIDKNTNRIMGSLLPLIATLIQPAILAQMIPMLGAAAHGVGTLVIILSSVTASSLVASKIFFGTARNTLVMGICLALLYILILR